MRCLAGLVVLHLHALVWLLPCQRRLEVKHQLIREGLGDVKSLNHLVSQLWLDGFRDCIGTQPHHFLQTCTGGVRVTPWQHLQDGQVSA